MNRVMNEDICRITGNINVWSTQRIQATVESVFEAGMIVSYTDSECNTYVGALLQQNELTKTEFPLKHIRNETHMITRIDSSHKTAAHSEKRKRRRKKKVLLTKTNAIDYSSKSCIVVCDDPDYNIESAATRYHMQAVDGIYYRKSKLQAYEKLQIQQSKQRRHRRKWIQVAKPIPISQQTNTLIRCLSQDDHNDKCSTSNHLDKEPEGIENTSTVDSNAIVILEETKEVAVNPLQMKPWSLSLPKLPLIFGSTDSGAVTYPPLLLITQ